MNVGQCISRVIIMLISVWIGLDVIRTTAGVRWLAISRSASLSNIVTTDICDRLRGLRKRQKKVCRKNVGLMDSVRLGSTLAIEECQHQFRHRRWNCSTINSVNIFGNVMKRGYREAAFTHAIASASVAYSVTRSCSSGLLHTCGCDRSIKGKSPKGFEWAGCSDNIAYGVAFSREFVDSADRKRKKLNSNKAGRPLMNLHNNEAGRRGVEAAMRVQCKCHGVSGSCELKTCWNALPRFRTVGNALKRKFDEATEVKLYKHPVRWLLSPVNNQFKPHTKEDLVYLEASPDFCDLDKETGSLGTELRRCNATSLALDGCDLMCCGRGHHSQVRTVVERCNCKFIWCCHVKCQECTRQVTEHRCH